MDWLVWMPYIVASIVIAVVAFFILNYLRTKKLPPTDEPVVGEYHIGLAVGTHIIPFQGTLHYFTKFLNPRYLNTFAQKLNDGSTVTKEDINAFRDYLQSDAHFYAMRQGTKKVAFISLHPIEMSPYFKTEQGSGLKQVYATGDYAPEEIGGFQVVSMTPIDQSTYTLNPPDYTKLDKTGKILATIFEKAPLLQELEAEQQKNKVMQGKVDEMADEVGRLKDEVEYWKYEAKRKGIAEPEEEGIKLPKWLKILVPYGISFGMGWLVFQNIPQLAQYHPVFGGALGLLVLFLGKKVLLK